MGTEMATVWWAGTRNGGPLYEWTTRSTLVAGHPGWFDERARTPIEFTRMSLSFGFSTSSGTSVDSPGYRPSTEPEMVKK